MDHNPFMTVNMKEGGEDIYCQAALATAGISSSCQQSTHCWPPLNHYRCRGDISNITCRLLPSNQLQCSYKEAHRFRFLHAFTDDTCVFFFCFFFKYRCFTWIFVPQCRNSCAPCNERTLYIHGKYTHSWLWAALRQRVTERQPSCFLSLSRFHQIIKWETFTVLRKYKMV